MKKLFTLALMAGFLFNAQSQTTFYTYPFSGSLGSWTTVDNTGTSAGVWIFKTNSISVPSLGTVSFSSPTANNGFALFMSDAANDDSKPEDADLLSPAINCSAHNFVFLQFDQYYYDGPNSSGIVYVSNDNAVWNPVYTISSTTPNPNQITLDISQYAANEATVYIKFNYVGDWDYFWTVDDVKLIVPVALDISVDTVTMSKYVGYGSQTVTGRVTNRGGTAINSFDLSYTDNGGTAVFQSFSGLNIAPLASYNFSFTQPVAMNSAIQHDIVVTAYSPNAGTDMVTSNNSWTQKVITLSAVPVKNVLMEEFTTASCIYCTGAVSRLNSIKSRHPELIMGQLHAGFGTDAMTITDHSTVATQYTTSAPAVMVDRVYYDSEKGADIGFYTYIDRWNDYALERKNVTTPVSIIADNTYNGATRELTVNVSAKFYSSITDDFRLNCYIIEDSVSGSGSGYNQTNGYNTTSYTRTGTGTAGQSTINVSSIVPIGFVASGTGIASGAMVIGISGTTLTLSLPNTGAVSGSLIFRSEWYGKGSPIAGYQHRHVVRQMLGGAWGSTTVIPSTTTEGAVYTKQYTYTLPATWDESQVTLVAVVQHYATNKFDRQILNAMEFHLNTADSTGVTTPSALPEVTGSPVGSIKLFPNPAQDVVNIDFSILTKLNLSMEVYNVMGQMVTNVPAEQLNAGDYTAQINTVNLNNGIYFVAVKDGNKVVQTLKFVISQ